MIRSLSLLALLALAPAVLAQDFPSTPPAPAAPRTFDIPEGRTLSLDNGVDVTLVPYGDLPKATVYAVVRVGNVDEAADQTGWSAVGRTPRATIAASKYCRCRSS